MGTIKLKNSNHHVIRQVIKLEAQWARQRSPVVCHSCNVAYDNGGHFASMHLPKYEINRSRGLVDVENVIVNKDTENCFFLL